MIMRRSSIAASLLLLSIAACAALAFPLAAQTLPGSPEIADAIAKRGFVRVIVQFAPPPAAADLRPGDPASIDALKSQIAARADAIIGDHFGAADAPREGAGFPRAIRRFDLTPGFAVNLDAGEYAALAADQRVIAITPDRLSAPQLNQSVPLLGMTAASAAGATGAGLHGRGARHRHPGRARDVRGQGRRRRLLLEFGRHRHLAVPERRGVADRRRRRGSDHRGLHQWRRQPVHARQPCRGDRRRQKQQRAARRAGQRRRARGGPLSRAGVHAFQ
jgi:hypothetical protein